ncbi:MAG: hypothetical protein DWQ07_20080 [Chloroflexi bacterium]|nr:MAG: hypothetical protein DWQ07_20080 [Chloroflexota bacterium]MBL1194380.1 hypothetical protein [Chloroflexota bacterium]NOH11668.1 hypothetical protein [Chloroflexota bacterium]
MPRIKAQNVNHPEHTENLNAEKYALIREAMLATLPSHESGEGMAFNDLEEKVAAYLMKKEVSPELFPKPGSVRWYTKAVQLDLEARGEIERLPGKSPIHLRKQANP